MFYFAHCINIIFNSLLAQLVKYAVHTTRKIKFIHAIFYHILLLYMMLLGLVQLEALESLNSTSEQKVRQFMEMLTKDAAESLKSELLQIRQVFDDVQASTDDGQFLAGFT